MPGLTPELTEGTERPEISFNGKALYSGSISPEKRAEKAPAASQTLYIVFSPLLFYGIDILLSRISKDSYILAIESNRNLFNYTLDFFKPYSANNISYIHLGKDSSPLDIIEALDPSKFRRVVPVRLNGGYLLDRIHYNTFAKQAETFLQTFWKNRMTTIHMGRLWCRNIFRNLPFLPGSESLETIRTDKHVIVAGAGESLDNCVSFINEHRNLFFVIAADTAVSTLLDSNIRPDLVIVLEAQHANLFDFYNPEALSLPAAFDLTSSTEIIRKHTGPKYFFISDFSRSFLFDKLENASLLPSVIPALGSVGIAAVYSALLLSTGYVFCCGLDFSFIPDKYHSTGSPSHLLSLINEDRLTKPGFYYSAYTQNRLKRTDKSGRTVYTDLVMLSYAESLNELSRYSGRIIDIAPSGLNSTENNIIDPKRLLHLCESTVSPVSCSAPVEGLIPATANNTAGYDPNYKNIRKFLEKEITDIDTALDAVICFLNNTDKLPNGARLTTDLSKLISKIDYAYLFFPDYYHPAADRSYLKRLLYSAAWFKENIINTLESGF